MTNGVPSPVPQRPTQIVFHLLNGTGNNAQGTVEVCHGTKRITPPLSLLCTYSLGEAAAMADYYGIPLTVPQT